MGNHEPEERKVNNAIEENTLGPPQYKLVQSNEKNSRERSQNINDQEMRGSEKKFRNSKLITVMGIPKAKLKYGIL